MNLEIQPLFFATSKDLRKWLDKNHKKEKELFVGYYKMHSGVQSITWSQSVDEALCFGWIDGVRKSIDKDRYFIRFTPRKPTSIWSAVNIKKVEDLTLKGLMKPQGLASFQLRKEEKSKIYAYEKEAVKLSHEFENIFKAHKRSWDFFQTLPPSYRRTAIHWIMSPKQETTRIKRLNELIIDSEENRKIKRLSY